MRAKRQLEEINIITLELQKEHSTLSECLFAIDTLIEAIQEGREKIGNPFFGCTQKFDDIKLDGRNSPDHEFESRVTKFSSNNLIK